MTGACKQNKALDHGPLNLIYDGKSLQIVNNSSVIHSYLISATVFQYTFSICKCCAFEMGCLTYLLYGNPLGHFFYSLKKI